MLTIYRSAAHLTLILGITLLSACTSLLQPSGPKVGAEGVDINLVDANQDGMPEGWRKLVLNPNKQKTLYTPVYKDGIHAVRADADSSFSGLQFLVRADPQTTPYLSWRWKVENLIASADNTKRQHEDSPVRIALAFEGDKKRLPFSEQMVLKMGKMLSGHETPYATLIYLWENRQPIGTVIPHGITERIKMIVAETGPQHVGEWQRYTRNYAADFERAFGEKPGRLLSIALITDSDNTESIARAWYGPLSLSKTPPHIPLPASSEPNNMAQLLTEETEED